MPTRMKKLIRDEECLDDALAGKVVPHVMKSAWRHGVARIGQRTFLSLTIDCRDGKVALAAFLRAGRAGRNLLTGEEAGYNLVCL